MNHQVRANINRVVIAATLLTTIAAVIQERLKPAELRHWQGKVFGFVPYDFRSPTWERVFASYWNPNDPRMFTDKVIGVGWAVNLPTVLRTLRLFGLMHDARAAEKLENVEEAVKP